MLVFILSILTAVAAWSPTDSYAPGNVSCPSNSSLVRKADSLSSSESEWLEKRHKVTKDALLNFLTYNNSLPDSDLSFYKNLNDYINVGIAFSGGGYRAMLAGAGELSALDNRTNGSFNYGLGGLLQSATYMAGLSGGNWLTGTIAYNNFTSVEDILNGGEIWDLTSAIYNPGGINILKTASVFDDIADDIEAKEDAGFNASLTDIWARSLSRQFFNDSKHGAALTFSTLRDAQVFSDAEMPLPISVADGRYPGTDIIDTNSTVFEMTPFEMGSWDSYLNSFVDIKYLGTNLSNGKPVTEKCIAGFDNAGFLMGTSSTLFNQFLLQLNTTGISGVLYTLADKILTAINQDDNDIADYTPNPFYNVNYGSSKSLSNSEHLYLVDGGEDWENIPLAPLIEPKREVDVIFAFDNSADTSYNWPDGVSMGKTYSRQFSQGAPFPYVPDNDTFLHTNLTARPVFFGCDATNLTSLPGYNSSSLPPLVVYTANRPFSYNSNTSTYKMTYTESEKRSMIQNGFEIASRNNLTVDSYWKTCVSCAIIRRAQERENVTQSDICKSCFDSYCWNGDTSHGTWGLNFTENGTTNGTGTTKNASNKLSSSYLWLLSLMVIVLVGGP